MSNSISYENRCILLINATYTSGALKDLENLIQKRIIVPENFKTATLNYNAHKGLGPYYGTPGYFPLKFISEDMEVWVAAVTAGYHGEGPRGTVEALCLMNFDVDYEMAEIIFTQKVTDETFNK